MLFVLDVQKYNQNNMVILLNFSNLTELSGFFEYDLGFKLVFGFGPELVGSFTTLIDTAHATTAYLCEQGFSTLVEIKSKKRNAIKDVDALMRGPLETRPRFSQLADEIQQKRSQRMVVEMTYWYKYIFSFNGDLFFSINVDAISV